MLERSRQRFTRGLYVERSPVVLGVVPYALRLRRVLSAGCTRARFIQSVSASLAEDFKEEPVLALQDLGQREIALSGELVDFSERTAEARRRGPRASNGHNESVLAALLL
jgi:hypothetical protein